MFDAKRYTQSFRARQFERAPGSYNCRLACFAEAWEHLRPAGP